ncbi:MAG: dipeptide epimerase, partial [Actinobacteria bacterium]|nr:dipeptide epimerase [Actinomycetota bacterium]
MELGARIVTLHLAETFVISRESRDEEEVVQVEVRHGELAGWGEAAPLDRYEETPAASISFLEGPGAATLGKDPFALEEIEARLGETPGHNAAKAALDGALHDLQG